MLPDLLAASPLAGPAVLALVAWLAVLLLPSRPYSTRERLEPGQSGTAELAELDDVVVLIPARNEADAIDRTVSALADQGPGLRAIVIDDQSEDRTADVARAAAERTGLALDVIDGQPLPPGWSGKLWALQQGFEHADRRYCIALDAEIVLAPGMIAAMRDKARRESRAIVSIMAKLRCESFWEKLLVPPFIFFFKMLYPFANVNLARRRTAAAAGGCILIETDVLRQIGAYEAIRDALIDDCTLAARVKRSGHSIWLGLSDAVTSLRRYPDLASFRRMVSRTAFTQLRYSATLLVLVALVMILVFVVPVVSLARPYPLWLFGAAALSAMSAAYWPTIRFYGLNASWVLTLPVAAVLFLAMTLESALNYWRGVKAEWKGRRYAARG
ncbi:MAG: glycosyltransferase [Gammaproteobacteria bacterium]|nr:glycosyltransferase [Gammaproteobacteria bacterium]